MKTSRQANVCANNNMGVAAAGEREGKPALPERPTLEQLDEFFRHDTFAYKQAGCRIVEGWRGHGVCEMVLEPEKHCNAQNFVMGGAVFTLADYAFAVASMCGEASSVSLSCSVEFITATRGRKLIATCDEDKNGRKVGFYTTLVHDDLGELVAKVSTTCYRPITG